MVFLLSVDILYGLPCCCCCCCCILQMKSVTECRQRHEGFVRPLSCAVSLVIFIVIELILIGSRMAQSNRQRERLIKLRDGSPCRHSPSRSSINTIRAPVCLDIIYTHTVCAIQCMHAVGACAYNAYLADSFVEILSAYISSVHQLVYRLCIVC